MSNKPIEFQVADTPPKPRAPSRYAPLYAAAKANPHTWFTTPFNQSCYIAMKKSGKVEVNKRYDLIYFKHKESQ